jgi:hypothetical protein
MAKPFICKEMISPTISIHTPAFDGSILLDPTDVGSNVVQVKTNLFNKNIVLSNDPTAEIKLAGGNIFHTASNGNISDVASGTLSEVAAFTTQSSLFVTRLPTTVSPAAAVYNQFDNTACPGVQELSRVNIVPAAGGTTINSIIVNPGNPNKDGQEIWFQNIGADNLTFTNLSGAGTVGGLIRTPGASYVVIPGGGVSIMFDETVDSPNGQWLVRGI